MTRPRRCRCQLTRQIGRTLKLSLRDCLLQLHAQRFLFLRNAARAADEHRHGNDDQKRMKRGGCGVEPESFCGEEITQGGGAAKSFGAAD